MNDFRIAAALINAFYSPRVSDKSDSIEIARLMKQKLNSKNNLEKYLNIHYSQSQKMFTSIDKVTNINFPQLEIETIKKHITFGTYQLKQCFGYLAEHFKINGSYKFKIAEQLISEQNGKIILTEIHSRHSNSVKYKVFVKFVPNSNDHQTLEWICSCKCGKRTVGCCTHVASVIYYLACGHRQEKIPIPGFRLKSLLIPVCLNEGDTDNGEDDDKEDENEEDDGDSENSDVENLIENSEIDELGENFAEKDTNLNSLMKRSLSFDSENQNNRSSKLKK